MDFQKDFIIRQSKLLKNGVHRYAKMLISGITMMSAFERHSSLRMNPPTPFQRLLSHELIRIDVFGRRLSQKLIRIDVSGSPLSQASSNLFLRKPLETWVESNRFLVRRVSNGLNRINNFAKWVDSIRIRAAVSTSVWEWCQGSGGWEHRPESDHVKGFPIPQHQPYEFIGVGFFNGNAYSWKPTTGELKIVIAQGVASKTAAQAVRAVPTWRTSSCRW